jgi:hypothetical protein
MRKENAEFENFVCFMIYLFKWMNRPSILKKGREFEIEGKITKIQKIK